MAREPFLEIKVNTDSVHFALELFRVAADLKPRLLPFRGEFTVDASEIQPLIRRMFLYQVDIIHYPRASLDELSKLDRSEWTLSASAAGSSHRVIESFRFELHAIGGAYPLLIRLLSCSYPLYPLLEQVIVRCHALWDGQLVSIDRQSHTLYGLFQHIDARTSSWLSLLEQEFFGATYTDQAPSIQRTALERKVLSGRARSTAFQQPESAAADIGSDAHLLTKEMGSGHTDSLSTRSLRRPREETRAKLAKLRELFTDKQSGKQSRLSWNFACQLAQIDLKTAEAYEPELKADWQAMDRTKR